MLQRFERVAFGEVHELCCETCSILFFVHMAGGQAEQVVSVLIHRRMMSEEALR